MTHRRRIFAGLLHQVANGGTIGAIEPVRSLATRDGDLLHIGAQLAGTQREGDRRENAVKKGDSAV